MQTAIPYVFMRGGTSRGPYFLRSDLPADLALLADVLIAAIGSGHPLNIDGIGGGAAVTTKVAMLSLSNDDWADIDYFFAQVSVEDKRVDFKPTCGNILAGVANAAIEMGLVVPTADMTEVKIKAVNTGAKIVARVHTPNQQCTYEGNTAIDGVPGSSSEIQLTFRGVSGSSTGAFLPTGNVVDSIDGIAVTCMDVAMPVVIAKASDFGLTGYESSEDLNANREFFDRMESIRCKAGELMGMGDVRSSVTPKFSVIAPAQHGGSVTARYFMPWSTHPTMAVTGAQCIASCVLTPGTVAESIVQPHKGTPTTVVLEHPLGNIDVLVEYSTQNGFALEAAGILRTARKIADGHLYIPSTVWDETKNG